MELCVPLISVSSIDSQGVGSRGNHTAVKQSTGYFCFALNGQGTAVGAVPKAGSVGSGQLQPSSPWPPALPALPRHSPGSRCPAGTAGTSQLSQERAVQEQSCGKGCHGWQCLGCCHTKPPGMALSPQEPGAGFTDQISLEFFKTFILGQSLPWTFI